MKKVILSLLLAVLLLSPSGFEVNTANAQLSAEAQAQLIAQLRVQIQALQVQIAQIIAARGNANANANVSAATLFRAMAQGLSGDDVKTLQAILAADANIYAEGLITGFFGPATARAVAKFQASQGLAATGVVDANTLAKLQVVLAERPIGLEIDASTGIRRPCAAIPPGHLVASGWLRLHAGVRPIVPTCQVLPPGISAKIEGAAGISAVTATSINANSATVNFSTSVAATGKVYYSTTSPVNTSTALNVSGNAGATVHSITLTNLSANTTYYFVVEARDSAGGVTTSITYSFATSASGGGSVTVDTSAPVIASVSASGVSSTGATINWSTNESATGKVYYSTSSPVNMSTSANVSGSASASSQSLNLGNLQANTTYYFIVESKDGSNNVSTSATYSFTTSASGSTDTTAPVIASVTAAVTANSTLVNWTTNESATGKVYYSTSTPVNLSTSSSASGSANLTAHAVNIAGLSANTRYYIVIESRDGSNNVSTSSEFQFTTLAQ